MKKVITLVLALLLLASILAMPAAATTPVQARYPSPPCNKCGGTSRAYSFGNDFIGHYVMLKCDSCGYMWKVYD